MLYPLRWFFINKRMIEGHKRGRTYLLTHVAEHLMHGDSRAALVVSSAPLRIAAFSGDLDGVALLHVAPAIARYIAELLSDDTAQIEARKAAIDEAEWTRTAELARAWLAERGTLARDSRPLHCGLPAHIR